MKIFIALVRPGAIQLAAPATRTAVVVPIAALALPAVIP
jgi:hypothetical protein